MLCDAPCNGLLRVQCHLVMKRASQVFLMLLVLLMQSAPLMAWKAPTTEKCPMACCAWLMEAGLGDCSCDAVPADDGQPQPVPMPTSSGRDFASQVVWVEQPFYPIIFPSREKGGTPPNTREHSSTPPQIRLTVLFCSFLT